MRGVSSAARQMLAAALIGALGLVDAAAQAAGDPAAGQVKAAVCAGCHGITGVQKDPRYPKLAGQNAAYIVKQIRDFQSGRRKDQKMGGVSQEHSLLDVEDIAAYFTILPAPEPEPVPQELFEQGELIYQGMLNCFECHGERGVTQDNDASFGVTPNVAAQHLRYLSKTMKEFRDGRRTNDPTGMMNFISHRLTDEMIEAVSAYMAALRVNVEVYEPIDEEAPAEQPPEQAP